MNVPARWALGVPLGLLGFVGSITLDGGHPQMLLQSTALLAVLGTAFGGVLALRGPAAVAALLRTALLGAPTDPATRAERLRDVTLLERLALLGACLGLFGGGTRAIANFRTPEQIGPALCLAIVSVVLALLFNVLFAMPLKQLLLPAMPAEERLPARAASARALHLFGVAALFVAGASFGSIGTGTSWGFQLLHVPALLMVLAALLPSLLAAPTAILTGPVSATRCRWFADSMWSAGTLATAVGTMHVFSVLDQPGMLRLGAAAAFASFALPAAFASLVSLRGTTAPADASEPVDTERSPYLAFAALVLASLAGMILLVALVIQRMPASHA